MKQEKEPKSISERVGNAFAVYAVLTTAGELLLRETELQMSKDHIDFKRERKQVINDLRKSIERTKYMYQRFTEECCMKSGAGAFESFDALLNDSNTIASLVMRFYNATYGDRSNNNGDEIRNFIRGLQVSDTFTEEQITKFEKQI